MDGAIRVVPAPDDFGRPRRLVAHATDAHTSCADANGNGNGGLVQAAADLRDARSGGPVRVALETLPEQDIDESGIYPLVLAIGDERWTVDARVTLGPIRRRGKRRRGGRHRR